LGVSSARSPQDEKRGDLMIEEAAREREGGGRVFCGGHAGKSTKSHKRAKSNERGKLQAPSERRSF